MPGTPDLVAEAVSSALKFRKRLSLSLTHPISAIDAAEKIGIEVRLVNLPSMEGMYVAGDEPQIILSSVRPQGRRTFTCAHEIGHHVFGHGDQFDELISEKKGTRQKQIKEITANIFAAYFLMPKTLIDSGMAVRRLTYKSINPVQVYGLANWLGVGYRTLVSHLLFGLRVISRDRSNELSRVEPRDIRCQLIGERITKQLHCIDCHWIGRAVDCEVGDYLLLPRDTNIYGSQLVSESIVNSTSDLVRVAAPGIAQVTNSAASWSAYVRISPRGFTGRSSFRFEEEVN